MLDPDTSGPHAKQGLIKMILATKLAVWAPSGQKVRKKVATAHTVRTMTAETRNLKAETFENPTFHSNNFEFSHTLQNGVGLWLRGLVEGSRNGNQSR